MEDNKLIYRKLQQHLDQHTLGFPATRSGTEIRVLQQMFAPQEAQLATCLTHRFMSLEQIYRRAEKLVDSPEQLVAQLDAMEKRGTIGVKGADGDRRFCLIPLVVGMYEGQLGKLTPQFRRDFDAYMADRTFGISMLSTALPQMRTVPVAKSIRPRHHVSTYDEVAALVAAAEPPFAIFECICRQKKGLEGTPCQVTDRKETCMAVGSIAQSALRRGMGRAIDRDEALAIIQQNQKEGLVLQPSNTQVAEFFCSCCGCCCGMLSMQKQIPKPVDFWAANFYAAVDAGACIGCGKCVARCQVGALRCIAEERCAAVDLNRCIGCGGCVTVCPPEAIRLEKKERSVTPPATGEELYDIIMAKKKGRLGQLKIVGKLIWDAVRTGQTHLLK